MKIKQFWKLFTLVLMLSLLISGCSSRPSTKDQELAGKWRYTLPGFSVITLDLYDDSTEWSGVFIAYHIDGITPQMEADVILRPSGTILMGQSRGRYGVTDVYIGGKFYGKRLTIAGLFDVDVHLHKIEPPENITLAGTSWFSDHIDATYIFNDDGTFDIDLLPAIRYIALTNHRDYGTTGTYTVDGIEVTLYYPEDQRVL